MDYLIVMGTITILSILGLYGLVGLVKVADFLREAWREAGE